MATGIFVQSDTTCSIWARWYRWPRPVAFGLGGIVGHGLGGMVGHGPYLIVQNFLHYDIKLRNYPWVYTGATAWYDPMNIWTGPYGAVVSYYEGSDGFARVCTCA